MHRPFLWMLALGFALSHGVAQADVWGYVDGSGMTHFADRQVDERYQIYFKSSSLQFDARKVMQAQERSARRRVASVGSLNFNPVADAAAGAKARRLVAMIDRSSAYKTISKHMQREAARNAVDLNLIKAIVAAESGFNSTAVSSAGAVGLMQIMPDTARSLGLQDDGKFTVEQKLTDPALNVRLGTRYLKFLIDKFPGRLDLAVASYNAGHGAVQRAGNAVPQYAETQNYVRTVLALYHTMRPGMVDALYANAAAMPLGRAAKGSRGRVSMTIAGQAARPGMGATPPQTAEISLAPAQLADAGSVQGPSAMDTVASKLAEAEGVALGKDVVVKARAARPVP